MKNTKKTATILLTALTLLALTNFTGVKAVDTEYVTNGSFETSADWPYPAYGWVGVEWERQNVQAHSGTFSIRVNSESTTYPQVTNLYAFSIPTNNITSVTAWVRGDGFASCEIISYWGTGETDYDVVIYTPPAGTWTRLNLTAITPDQIYSNIAVVWWDVSTTYVYIDDISIMANDGTPAATPTATPIPDPSVDQAGFIAAIANYLVALFIVLLPAGILGALFRMGAWGFLIGLAIGAGLGFMLMPLTVPIWLFFAVVVGIVGMLFKSNSSGV